MPGVVVKVDCSSVAEGGETKGVNKSEEGGFERTGEASISSEGPLSAQGLHSRGRFAHLWGRMNLYRLLKSFTFYKEKLLHLAEKGESISITWTGFSCYEGGETAFYSLEGPLQLRGTKKRRAYLSRRGDVLYVRVRSFRQFLATRGGGGRELE